MNDESFPGVVEVDMSTRQGEDSAPGPLLALCIMLGLVVAQNISGH